MIQQHSKLKLPVFLLCILLSGSVLAQKDTLSFLHITDLHLIFNLDGYNPEMMDYRKTKQYDQGEGRLRQFLQSVPDNTKSDMVIATGDLIDFFEAETRNNKMLDNQVEQFSQLLDDYQVKVLLALGNHDIFTFGWRDNSLKVHQNRAVRSRAAWTRNVACFKNGTYYSESFQVGKATYKFIFLDDSFYQFLPQDTFEIPYIDKPQLYWLNAQLHESDSDIEIIFMHIPLKDTVAHPEYSKELYSALSANASVKLILAGHNHLNTVKELPSAEGKKMVQVQTGALVLGEGNWRLVRLTENNILVSVPGGKENELVIPLN